MQIEDRFASDSFSQISNADDFVGSCSNWTALQERIKEVSGIWFVFYIFFVLWAYVGLSGHFGPLCPVRSLNCELSYSFVESSLNVQLTLFRTVVVRRSLYLLIEM